MSEIIGVVGAGTMGNGIAQVAARAGYAVIMRDVNDEFLQRGLGAIDKSLQRDVDKQRLDAPGKQAIVERIRTTTDLEALSEASFVIEAVTENLAVKTEVFKALDRITPPQAAAFSMQMLGGTPSGDAYTFTQLDQMFRNAGFSRSEIHELPPSVERLIVSYK